jgi:hypothetical protein
MKTIVLLLGVVILVGCANESTPRMQMFDSMKEACDGDSSCVRNSAMYSFPYSGCTEPCRRAHGWQQNRACREKCLGLQRDLLDEGVNPAQADWTVIWEETEL